MIPTFPVQWMDKREADEKGLSQIEIREALIADALELRSHPHTDGLGPSGKPEVVFRTIVVKTQWGDSEPVEGYCIWIEKDEDGKS